MDETSPRRSRRNVLFGGLAAAAAVAFGRTAQPDRVAAANGDPVLAGSPSNAASATTRLTTSDQYGFVGQSTDEEAAGLVGIVGNNAPPAADGIDAGVYGIGIGGVDTSVGVWGDTDQFAGVMGSGPWGVYGTGGVGVAGDVGAGGTGVYGFVGDSIAPIPAANVAVEARAESTSQRALNVVGKATFSRSGRVQFNPGVSAVTVNLAGVSRASLILATPQTYQAGVWVVVAAPFTNLFVIRLNKAPTVTYFVSYMVLN